MSVIDAEKIVKNEAEFSFNLNGTDYTVKLVKHRPKRVRMVAPSKAPLFYFNVMKRPARPTEKFKWQSCTKIFYQICAKCPLCFFGKFVIIIMSKGKRAKDIK